MILLVTKSYDTSTDNVIDWLYHLASAEVLRFNIDDVKPISIELNVERAEIFVNGHRVDSIWFRKHSLNLMSSGLDKSYLADLNHFLYSIFFSRKEMEVKILGSPLLIHQFNRLGIETTINKVYRHQSKTIISNTDKFFFDVTYVSKSIGDIRKKYRFKGEKIGSYHFCTDRINSKHGIRYYQEYINVKYELRLVVVKDFFFCVKKIKSENSKRCTDIREAEVIRLVSCEISEDDKKNILAIMNYLSLDYCTMDILVGRDDMLHIVDVNPQGQYDIVDIHYNQAISKEIAKILIENEK